MSNFQLNPNAYEFVPSFLTPLESSSSVSVISEEQKAKKNSANNVRKNYEKHDKQKGKKKDRYDKYEIPPGDRRKKFDKAKSEKKVTNEKSEVPLEQTTKPVNTYLSALLKSSAPVTEVVPSIPIPQPLPTPPCSTNTKIVASVTRNRVETTVSINALNKFKSKWMQISQNIAERNKQQAIADSATVSSKSRPESIAEGGKWHSILKVPLPPVAFYDVPSSSSRQMTTIATHSPPFTSIAPNNLQVMDNAHIVPLEKKWWEANSEGNFETIQSCIQEGIDWELRYDHSKLLMKSLSVDCNGLTILHLLCKMPNTSVCLERVLSTYSFIGKHLDLKDRVNKRTPLHYACAEGHWQCCQLLVKYANYLSFTEKDRYGDTPLHLACKGNHFPIVTFLIEKMKKQESLKVNTRNKKGQTPIMLTTSHQILTLLLDYGADVTNKDENGLDLIQLSIQANDTYRLRKCLFHNSFRSLMNQQEDSLFGGSSGGSTTTKSTCLSPLHLAVSLGHRWCVEILLSTGYYPLNEMELNANSECYFTPLMYAFQQNQYDIILLLLQSEAEFGHCNELSLTEIGMAMYYQHDQLLFSLSQYLKKNSGAIRKSVKQFLPQRIVGPGRGANMNPMKIFTIPTISDEDNLRVLLRLLWSNAKKELFKTSARILTKADKLNMKAAIREQYLTTFTISIACGNVPVPKVCWEILCSEEALVNLHQLQLVENWPVLNMQTTDDCDIDTILDMFPNLSKAIKNQVSLVNICALRPDTCDVVLLIPSTNNPTQKVLVHSSVLKHHSALLRRFLSLHDDEERHFHSQEYNLQFQKMSIPYSGPNNAQEYAESKELLCLSFLDAFLSAECIECLLEYFYTGWIDSLSVHTPAAPTNKNNSKIHPILENILGLYPFAAKWEFTEKILIICEDKVFSMFCEGTISKESVEMIKAMMHATCPDRSRFARIMDWYECNQTAPRETNTNDIEKYCFYFDLKSNQVVEDTNLSNLNIMYKKMRDFSLVPIVNTSLVYNASSTVPSCLEVSVEWVSPDDAYYWSAIVQLKRKAVSGGLFSFGRPNLGRYTNRRGSSISVNMQQCRRHRLQGHKMKFPSEDFYTLPREKNNEDNEWYLGRNCFLVEPPQSTVTNSSNYVEDNAKEYVNEIEKDLWSSAEEPQRSQSMQNSASDTVVVDEEQQGYLQNVLVPQLFLENFTFLQQRMDMWFNATGFDIIMTSLSKDDFDHKQLHQQRGLSMNVVNQEYYYVHQDILITNSEKLSAMIRFYASQEQHYTLDKVLIISLPTIKPWLLGILLQYMYTGRIDHSVMEGLLLLEAIDVDDPNAKQAQLMSMYLDVAVLADEYLMSTLVTQATLQVVQQLNIENVNMYYQLACEARLSLLQQVTALYLLRLLNTAYTVPIHDLVDLQGMLPEADADEESEMRPENEALKSASQPIEAKKVLPAAKKPEMSQELLDFLLYIMESIIM